MRLAELPARSCGFPPSFSFPEWPDGPLHRFPGSPCMSLRIRSGRRLAVRRRLRHAFTGVECSKASRVSCPSVHPRLLDPVADRESRVQAGSLPYASFGKALACFRAYQVPALRPAILRSTRHGLGVGSHAPRQFRPASRLSMPARGLSAVRCDAVSHALPTAHAHAPWQAAVDAATGTNRSTPSKIRAPCLIPAACGPSRRAPEWSWPRLFWKRRWQRRRPQA